EGALALQEAQQVGHLLEVGRHVRVVALDVDVVELDVDDVLDAVAEVAGRRGVGRGGGEGGRGEGGGGQGRALEHGGVLLQALRSDLRRAASASSAARPVASSAPEAGSGTDVVAIATLVGSSTTCDGPSCTAVR